MSSSADDDVELPFISHLAELRDRLLRAIMAVLLVLIALIPFAGDIYTRLATPLIAKLPKQRLRLPGARRSISLRPSLPHSSWSFWSRW